MKLYTFQPLFIWQHLEELGYWHPHGLYDVDEFLAENEDYPWSFRESYDWLKGQMNARDVKYLANNEHMIWAWYQWYGTKMAKPDKRYKSVYDYMEVPYVLMELDIPDDRVLLHDYDLWHHVLNYSYVGDETEYQAFVTKYGRKAPAKADGHAIISRTWETIFDLPKAAQVNDMTDTPDLSTQVVQATFWELFYTDVTKVHFFENKKCVEIRKIKHK